MFCDWADLLDQRRLRLTESARQRPSIMIWTVKRRLFIASLICLSLLTAEIRPGLAADKPKDKPLQGAHGPARVRDHPARDRALRPAEIPLRRRSLASREGRELVIAESSGPWIRVFANTDAEEVNEKDKPIYGSDTITPPVSGWIQARGVVRDSDARRRQGADGRGGASMEILAEDARGPRNAGQTARLLYRRLVEFYPNSPLTAEAAWRAADIRWQFEKADAARLPSSKERGRPTCASSSTIASCARSSSSIRTPSRPTMRPLR